MATQIFAKNAIKCWIQQISHLTFQKLNILPSTLLILHWLRQSFEIISNFQWLPLPIPTPIIPAQAWWTSTTPPRPRKILPALLHYIPICLFIFLWSLSRLCKIFFAPIYQLSDFETFFQQNLTYFRPNLHLNIDIAKLYDLPSSEQQGRKI